MASEGSVHTKLVWKQQMQIPNTRSRCRSQTQVPWQRSIALVKVIASKHLASILARMPLSTDPHYPHSTLLHFSPCGLSALHGLAAEGGHGFNTAHHPEQRAREKEAIEECQLAGVLGVLEAWQIAPVDVTHISDICARSLPSYSSQLHCCHMRR